MADHRRVHAEPFTGHIIDGREVESASGRRFETLNPYTREVAGVVALGEVADVEAAVAAARRAFDGPWPRMGFAERGRLMHALADLVEEHAGALAHADVTDVGKPIAMASGFEVPRVAANLRSFADQAQLGLAEAFPNDAGFHVYTRYEPAGVVAAIIPWNVPVMMASWKIAPALAWGNTVVAKPAEDSPVSATLLAKLALEAGFPPGVLNVVHGFGAGGAGQALTEHQDVDRITFTGETGTGRAISRAAADNLVPVSLELGGKSAHLVFADADLDRAATLAVQASFMNAGQICFSGNRVLVERSVYEPFLERYVAAAEAMVVGDPLDPATQIGALASQAHHEKVSGYLHGVGVGGGRILTGGPGDGWTMRPTIVADVPADAPLWCEEVFGPIAAVAPFDDEGEAVAAANAGRYGLSALVSTESIRRAQRLTTALAGGLVWVNTYPFRDPRAPYGGLRDSGVGREGGTFSRDFFTEPKQVVVGP